MICNTSIRITVFWYSLILIIFKLLSTIIIIIVPAWIHTTCMQVCHPIMTKTFSSAMQVTVTSLLLFVQLLSLTSAVELKVGIYNEIPDLGNDHLASYKAMIQKGFSDATQSIHTVDAVVDKTKYSPYDGKLKEHLSAEHGFDLIEMDTAMLKEVVEEDLVKEVDSLPDDIMPAAASAVQINGHLYGYPTLVCGNFLIGLTPGTVQNCPLKESRADFTSFKLMIEKCESSLLLNHPSRERILGGKMNDKSGWYLPFLYLDGYIDIHGFESAAIAVDEVIKGVVDPQLCERLSWYISCCDAKSGGVENKCFTGSYVADSDNVYADINSGETVFFYGFSEKLGQIKRDTSRQSYTALAVPLGNLNNLLQFTDALVINQARWEQANEEKKNAIMSFVNYFLSLNLRSKIAMGEDLPQPQVRYLLQANDKFYQDTNDPIYKDLYWSLKRAVASPSLTDYQKKIMQQVLTQRCVKLSPVSKEKPKEEL